MNLRQNLGKIGVGFALLAVVVVIGFLLHTESKSRKKEKEINASINCLAGDSMITFTSVGKPVWKDYAQVLSFTVPGDGKIETNFPCAFYYKSN